MAKSKKETENAEVNLDKESVCRVECVAEMFSLSVRRIQQLTQEGILHTVKHGSGRRYLVFETVNEYLKHQIDKKNKNGNSAKLSDRKLEVEIALKESKTELQQLHNKIAKGEYIAVSDVQKDYQEFMTVFRKFALAIPARVGGILSDYADPVAAREAEKDINAEIINMLNSFIVSANEKRK